MSSVRKPISKVAQRTRLSALAEELHQQKLSIVTTNGCFDVLHPGHISYLNQAKDLGDIFIVGINSNRSVAKLKGPKRPIHDEQDRALQIAALECVDFVSVFDEDTPETLIQIIRPSIHVKGGDYKLEDLPEKAVIESVGGKIVLLPFLSGHSTTKILDSL